MSQERPLYVLVSVPRTPRICLHSIGRQQQSFRGERHALCPPTYVCRLIGDGNVSGRKQLMNSDPCTTDTQHVLVVSTKGTFVGCKCKRCKFGNQADTEHTRLDGCRFAPREVPVPSGGVPGSNAVPTEYVPPVAAAGPSTSSSSSSAAPAAATPAPHVHHILRHRFLRRWLAEIQRRRPRMRTLPLQLPLANPLSSGFVERSHLRSTTMDLRTL